MNRILFLLLALFSCGVAFAQRNVPLKNLWSRPQVHVLFEGYSVSFTIKDIDKALSLLAEIGDTSFGSACGLDTSGNYYTELYSGSKMEYHNKLQLLLQNAVGCFLLSKGHATVERTRHKQLKVIIMDIMAPVATQDEEYLLFYDPHSGKRIFSGKMLQEMFDKDLGID